MTSGGMNRVCDLLEVGEPEVWAVLTVETRGFGFLQDRRPQILFERHIFSRQTGGRFDAAHSDISNRSPGGYLGAGREYDRLERATALDQEAALKCASWGLAQVKNRRMLPDIGLRAAQVALSSLGLDRGPIDRRAARPQDPRCPRRRPGA